MFKYKYKYLHLKYKYDTSTSKLYWSTTRVQVQVSVSHGMSLTETCRDLQIVLERLKHLLRHQVRVKVKITFGV